MLREWQSKRKRKRKRKIYRKILSHEQTLKLMLIYLFLSLLVFDDCICLLALKLTGLECSSYTVNIKAVIANEY